MLSISYSWPELTFLFSVIFSDEDTVEGTAHRLDPWFKPDWNPALMLACNTFGRLGAYRRSLVQRLGGFRAGFDGAEDYDLVLRCAAATEVNRIRHIARVLYHRRATESGRGGKNQPGDDDAGGQAIADHLAVQGIAARVCGKDGQYQVSYAMPTPCPRVSILIATTARPDIAEPCFTSLLQRTIYDDFEVLLLVNRSVLNVCDRSRLLKRIAEKPQVRIIEYPDRPFNYSAVNNFGATQASGQVICFLNDDTEIVAVDWLEVLVSRVSLPQVGAAGPMLYYPDGTIQHAGVILGLGGIAGHAHRYQPRGSRGYFGRACLEQDVSCVTAACMVIRAKVFRALGGFDETLPLAYNAAQYAHDVAFMRERWGPLLQADPFYNPNLALERDYSLAFPPRHTTKRVP
jgi:hypothetical protein